MAKVMISMPEDLLEEIDRVARESGRSRSGLLQYVARLYLMNPRRPKDVPDATQSLERAWEASRRLPRRVDWTAEIRRIRDSR
jgi:CopG-like RHH_1 or ribbon-helix-helix domain, RHH_5